MSDPRNPLRLPPADAAAVAAELTKGGAAGAAALARLAAATYDATGAVDDLAAAIIRAVPLLGRRDSSLGVIEFESVGSLRLVARTPAGTFPIVCTEDDVRRIVEALPSAEIRAAGGEPCRVTVEILGCFDASGQRVDPEAPPASLQREPPQGRG